MRRIVPFLILAACGTATTSDDTTDATTDEVGETGDSSDTDIEVTCSLEPIADDCAGDIASGGAKLTGKVTDQNGNAIGNGGVRVQFCREICLVPDCYDGNTYTFGGLDAGPGAYDVVPLCEDERLATPFAPITLDEAATRTIDIVVPKLGPATAIPDTAAEIEVVDGLYLTIGKGDLSKPTPLDPEATEVAGVDATAFSVPIEGITGDVLAVYYLHPFDYPADGGLTVRLDDGWTLGSGNGELWVGNYDDIQWDKVGDLVDDGDGKLTPGAKLPRISTLVVVKKPVEGPK